jgi:tetratricopeptide (TPR) repeat protein
LSLQVNTQASANHASAGQQITANANTNLTIHAQTVNFSEAGSSTVNYPAYLPYIRNKQFTGRRDKLTQLAESLQEQGVNTLVQTVKGLGGIGKTQLALEYAYLGLETSKYQLVWWLVATNETTLINGYLSLANELGIPEGDMEKRIPSTKMKLSSICQWLLIFDDVPHYKMIYPYLPTIGKGHVLITSRSVQGWPQNISLDVFVRTESIDYLAEVLNKDASNEEFRREADALAALLGDLPLALSQASAYIAKTKITITKYISYYSDKSQQLLAKKDENSTYPYTVLTTWTITIEHIKKSYPQVEKLLQACIYVTNQLIPRKIIIDWLKYELMEDELTANEILGELAQYSLIVLDEQALSLHALVQKAIQLNFATFNETKIVKRLLKVINTVYPPLEDSSSQAISQRGLLIPHLSKAIDHAKKIKGSNNIENESKLGVVLGTALFNLGYAYKERSNYQEAIAKYQESLIVHKQAYGSIHPDIAATLNSLGMVYHEIDKLNEALNCYQESKRIYEQFPHRKIEMADVWVNIGNIYADKGEWDSALYYLNKGLEIRKDIHGIQAPKYADTLNDIANIYWEKREYQAALKSYQQFLQISIQAYGELSADVAMAYANIGALYIYIDEYIKAEENLKKALQLRIGFYGEKHADVAVVYNSLASLSLKAKNYPYAIYYYQKALTINSSIHGKYHHFTGLVIDNISAIFDEFFNDYVAAHDCYMLSIAILHKYHNPAYILALNNLGSFYEKYNKINDAKECFKYILSLYGENDSRSIGTLERLGDHYYYKGLYNQAVHYYEQACKLGIVLNVTYKRLGNCYKSLNSFFKAESCYKKVLELIYSEDDTNKLDILYTLGDFYMEQGRTDEALIYYEQAVALNTDSSVVYVNLANLYEQADEYTKAKANYLKAIDLDATSLSYCEYGRFLYGQGKFDDAIFYLKKAIEIISDLDTTVFYYSYQKKILYDKYLQNELEEQGKIEIKSKFLAYHLLICCHNKLKIKQEQSNWLKCFTDSISDEIQLKEIVYRLLNYAYGYENMIQNNSLAEKESTECASLENESQISLLEREENSDQAYLNFKAKIENVTISLDKIIQKLNQYINNNICISDTKELVKNVVNTSNNLSSSVYTKTLAMESSTDNVEHRLIHKEAADNELAEIDIQLLEQAKQENIDYEKRSILQQYFEAMELELMRLNSLALPEAFGGTNEIIKYLKDSIKNEDVVINSFEWDLHPDTSQTGGEQVENYNFPFANFINDFLQHSEKRKFVLPLLLKQAHFVGLAIIKQADKCLVKYINSTGSNPLQKGEDKEALAKIKQALQKLMDEHEIVFEEIEILSNKQQLNESDCAFIVAQTLVEVVLEQEISIKPYSENMETYVKPIAQARAHFYSQERLGDSYESAIRDQLYSRLAKALTTNWADYAIPLQKFIRKADANIYGLDDALLQQMQVLIQRIDKGNLQDLLGSELTSQATYFFNASLILKNIKLIEIKKFCDKLLKPHFTEQGSLIFKLNDNLQNHAKKSENGIEGMSSSKQTNKAHHTFFKSLSSNSAKMPETQDEAEKLDELAEIEELLVNQAIQESKPVGEPLVEFQQEELQQHKGLN